MLKFVRAEFILMFLLGVASIATFQTILSYQTSVCVGHQQISGADTPDNASRSRLNEPTKREHGTNQVANDPVVCGIAGIPAALRKFMNHNEGFFVGGFTFMLVFVTAWLVWATLKLWRAGEEQRASSEEIANKQRLLSERIASQQSTDTQSSLSIAARSADAAMKSIELAERHHREAHRAFIFAHPTFVVEGGQTFLRIRIENAGSTLGILRLAHGELSREEPAGDVVYKDTGTKKGDFVVAPRNNADGLPHYYPFSNWKVITDEEHFFFGFIEYVDIFRERHFSRFCARLFPLERTFDVAGPPAWNDWD
jgi:hypothetical protein